MKNTNLCCIFLVLACFISKIEAQRSVSPYEVGIHAGTTIYLGDLTPSLPGSYKTPGLFLGVSASKKLNKFFSVRGDFSLGKIHASDSNYAKPVYRQQRNFGFKSSITEISASIVWNPLGEGKLFIPYLFGGVGYSFLKISRDFSKFNPEYFNNEPSVLAGLTADIDNTPPRGIGVIPIGVGIRYSLSDRISLSFETSYRLMSTDYLDGFSKAADPLKKDHYYTHTFGFNYSFAGLNRLACPK